jgi:hypothetical protein
MKDCLLYVLIVSVLFLASPITHGAETERGAGGIVSVLITDKQDNQVGLYKESYALVIGASNYTNGWPKLSGVKKDVQLIDIILKQHGFKVVTVKDPGQEQLNRAFNEFINKYGRKPESRLLFYFAGHGYTLKQSYGEEMGYVIPVDAPAPEKNINGFMDKAMDMQQIEVFANGYSPSMLYSYLIVVFLVHYLPFHVQYQKVLHIRHQCRYDNLLLLEVQRKRYRTRAYSGNSLCLHLREKEIWITMDM